MIIVVGGSPGTGKTTLASHLRRIFNLEYVSLTEIVLEYASWYSYDWEHRSFLIDDTRVVSSIRRVVRRNPLLVLEAHDVEILFDTGVEPNVVIITRCHPRVLYARLIKRQWPLQKLIENLEAELIGYTAQQAYTYFGRRVCEIDTTNKPIDELLGIVEKAIVEGDFGKCERVDWLLNDDAVEFVSRIALEAYS